MSARLIAVLAVALMVVLAACQGSDSESGPPSEVIATAEAFQDAVNSYDADAVEELVTDDYTWQSTGPVQDLDEYLAYIDAHYERLGFHVALAGERVISVDGESYVVEERGIVTASESELFGTTVHRIVEAGGGWLIQQSRWTEDPPETTG